MTENERKTMMNIADNIQGEINRMCVTKELAEFDTMYGHAKRNLDKLSKMIYDARFKEEGENAINDAPTIESEIIRCKDCKHFKDYFEGCVSYFGLSHIRTGEEYCYNAERRTD